MLMSKAAVDYCADVNHQRLHKLSRLMNVPEFVETAPIIEQRDVATLPVAVFADPTNRKFPLHTKAATWLAQAYFSHDRHLYTTQQASGVQDKIDKAAAYWSITDFTKQARTEVDNFTSNAPPQLTDEDYALIVDHDGKKTPMLPIHNAESIKASAATLYNMRGKCPYEYRLIASRKIIHKAAALGVDLDNPELSDYLVKAAGQGSVFPARAANHIANRVLMIPDSQKEVKVAAAKLAQTVSKLTGLPSAEKLVKLAFVIDRIDREQGFNKYYDEGGVSTPEEILFELTHEKAAAIRNSYLTLTTGTVYPFEALQNAPLSKIASALGFLDRVQSEGSLDVSLPAFAKIASTLPRNDAALLDQLLRSANIPVAKTTVNDVM